jgi:CRISPR-associated protein Cmr4
MQAKLYFIHALSPLHAGTGQGVGVIDLPIAREKATNLPYVPGSSIKGVLRDQCRAQRSENLISVFGPETEGASDHASSLQLTDARLLLLPVRSLAGAFAWVTSPYLLNRFVRDLAMTGASTTLQAPLPQLSETAIEGIVAEGSALALIVDGRTGVFLEDLDLVAKVDKRATQWANFLGAQLWPTEDEKVVWRTALRQRICIIPDDAFSFLLETATEVVARIRLEDATKTVAQGQLWYEEALPAETVLTGLAVAVEVKAKPAVVFATVEALTKSALQFGGKATVGRGLCHMRISS